MRLTAAIAVLISIWPSLDACAQQLTDVGMLAVGVTSRTRLGGADCQLGDLFYIMAIHPANSGQMYVSAHMEFRDERNQWLPTPTARTALGEAYRSPKYNGLRDYVVFEPTSVNTTRHVCLFMPYEAAFLPTRRYDRRYVIRVWDHGNREIANTVLSPESVNVERENGKLVIRVISVRTCAMVVSEATTPDPVPQPVPDPVPTTVNEGGVRFFDTATGDWTCPSK